MPNRRPTACQTASCPVTASGWLMPLSAIQSMNRSHCAQSHQDIE